MDLENATSRHGLTGAKDSAGISEQPKGGKYTIAQLYDAVKKIARKDGGLKYSDSEKNELLFAYSETEGKGQYAYLIEFRGDGNKKGAQHSHTIQKESPTYLLNSSYDHTVSQQDTVVNTQYMQSDGENSKSSRKSMAEGYRELIEEYGEMKLGEIISGEMNRAAEQAQKNIDLVENGKDGYNNAIDEREGVDYERREKNAGDRARTLGAYETDYDGSNSRFKKKESKFRSEGAGRIEAFGGVLGEKFGTVRERYRGIDKSFGEKPKMAWVAEGVIEAKEGSIAYEAVNAINNKLTAADAKRKKHRQEWRCG